MVLHKKSGMVTWAEAMALGTVTVLVGLVVYNRAGALSAGVAAGCVALVVALVYAIGAYGHRGHRTRGGVITTSSHPHLLSRRRVEGEGEGLLPDHAMNLILSMLDLKDLAALSQVSKYHRNIANTSLKPLQTGSATPALKHYPGISPSRSATPKVTFPYSIAPRDLPLPKVEFLDSMHLTGPNQMGKITAVFASPSNSTVVFYDSNSGRLILNRLQKKHDISTNYHASDPILDHDDPKTNFQDIRVISASSDLRLVVASSDEKIHFWRFDEGSVVKEYPLGSEFTEYIISRVILDSSGSHLACSLHRDHSAKAIIINTDSLDVVRKFEFTVDEPYGGYVDFRHDGRAIAYGHLIDGMNVISIRSFDAGDEKTINMPGNTIPVFINLRDNGENIVVLDSECSIHLWDLREDSPVPVSRNFGQLVEGTDKSTPKICRHGVAMYLPEKNQVFAVINFRENDKPYFQTTLWKIDSDEMFKFVKNGFIADAYLSEGTRRYILLRFGHVVSLRNRHGGHRLFRKDAKKYWETFL